jgi:hypothetical protein
MDDFHTNLKLCIKGIDPCKGEEMTEIVTNAKPKHVFGRKEHIG